MSEQQVRQFNTQHTDKVTLRLCIMAGLRSLDVSVGGSGVGIGPGRLMLIHTIVEHTALSRRHMIFPE